MKRMLPYLIHLVIIVSVAIGIYEAKISYMLSKSYDRTMQEAAALATPKALATSKLKSVAETLTFGWIQNDIKQRVEKLSHTAEITRQNASKAEKIALESLSVAAIFAALLSLQAFLVWGAVVSLVALAAGVFTPMLNVTLHKQVEYLGDIVFSFESKSILDTISHLFATDNLVVGSVIVLFSVIVPILKTIVMGVTGVTLRLAWAHRMILFLKHLGKWSMLDVFVVATLLVFLSLKSGDVSRAEVEVGVYFFLMYVVLSVLLSIVAERLLRSYR